ncbi:hypothetical protein EVAR_38681_1 [Eumeta japonica]|uniref:Uncharacterized protein n=1 Tax=Eumeta variegata TaxID=151549 RepID=A0A4C1Y6Y2_EUMVA|nr:hypothetical protein EVAR_38681_1 [Eumeta japonica]
MPAHVAGNGCRRPDDDAPDKRRPLRYGPGSMSENSIAVLTVRLAIEDRFLDPGRTDLIGLNSTHLIGRYLKDESENSKKLHSVCTTAILHYYTLLHLVYSQL